MCETKLELFAIDPRGWKVYCSEEQMEQIYDHHPELRNFWADEEDFKKAIAEALFIYQSTHGPNFHVYYRSRPRKNIELKIVVHFGADQTGIIIAAQPSTIGRRKPGEIPIWPSLNP